MGKRTQTAVAAWVDPSFAERFAALARQNERSASAEARLALRRHLENASPAATGNHKPVGDAPAGSVAADSNQLGAQAALLPGAASPASDLKGQTCRASSVA